MMQLYQTVFKCFHSAGLMLTTEAMIADAPDEKSDGGMGGMGMGM